MNHTVLGQPGARIEDILASLRDLPVTVQQLTEAVKTLTAKTAALTVPRAPPGVISARPITDVFNVSFNQHLFIRAPHSLKPLPEIYNLPHPAEAVIVQGTYDYQVEYDRSIQNNTPITPALEYQNFPLVVQKSISYQISPAVVQQLGQNIEGSLYIWMFWRE